MDRVLVTLVDLCEWLNKKPSRQNSPRIHILTLERTTQIWSDDVFLFGTANCSPRTLCQAKGKRNQELQTKLVSELWFSSGLNRKRHTQDHKESRFCTCLKTHKHQTVSVCRGVWCTTTHVCLNRPTFHCQITNNCCSCIFRRITKNDFLRIQIYQRQSTPNKSA